MVAISFSLFSFNFGFIDDSIYEDLSINKLELKDRKVEIKL